MRAKVAIWIALGAWVLISLGCSSITARTKPRNVKYYPGVHHFDLGDGPGPDMAAGMLAMGDLALSAITDTLLLPIDALHQPKGKQQEFIEGTYAGLYRFGHERSDFKLLGSGEGWWLSGDIEEVTRRMAGFSADEPPELRNPVFLVVEGDLSKRGHYGHLGAYRRELRVTKVLEVQQMSPDVP